MTTACKCSILSTVTAAIAANAAKPRAMNKTVPQQKQTFIVRFSGSPDLLKRLKSKAVHQGMSLQDFLGELIEKAV